MAKQDEELKKMIKDMAEEKEKLEREITIEKNKLIKEIIIGMILVIIIPEIISYTYNLFDNKQDSGSLSKLNFDGFIDILKSIKWPSAIILSIILFLISPYYANYVNRHKNKTLIKKLEETINKREK